MHLTIHEQINCWLNKTKPKDEIKFNGIFKKKNGRAGGFDDNIVKQFPSSIGQLVH